MTTRTDERVGDWESVPFAGGYEGLHELATDEFSGAVVAGPTRLFMLNGTVVGVLDGDIEDFEDAAGTAREAPHEALPLLAVMQDRADEVRAKYYTEETAIDEVDRTLADGKFTGFIELSENVLSGDYYVVYHQGRSMSVAWVGTTDTLITDDEAFDQANDEVGIYEVKPVEITPIEIPEPENTGGADAAAVATEDSASAGADDEPAGTPETDDPDSSPADSSTASGSDDTDDEPTNVRERGGNTPAAGGPPGSKAAGSSQGTPVRAGEDTQADPAAEQDTEPAQPESEPTQSRSEATQTESEPTPARSEATQTESEPADQDADPAIEQRYTKPAIDGSSTRAASSGEASQGPATDDRSDTSPNGRDQQRTRTQPPSSSQSEASSEGASAATAADLETRSIPSLDPEQSASSTDQSAAASTESDSSPDTGPRRDRPRSGQSRPTETRPSQSQPSGSATHPASPQSSESSGPDQERVATLESDLADREEEISRLEGEVERLETTAEDLRSERDQLQSDLDAARTEVERLEDQLEEAQGAVTGAGTRLTESEAISKTNLFVRYHSKGEATLAKAHDGEVGREAVEENLRLEYHTQFEVEDAAVDGQPFEAFLHGTMQYRFVDWLIRHLLYEIANTGHASGMQDLFDAIPRIDRAELNGQVSVTYVEDGEEHRSQERFDVVVRDRMGNPLIVANMNDSRDPATEKQMTTLVRDGERVGNASETLAAAFLVTSSFFEPGALETAEEATSSGLFSRDKRESYVNLSRKDGYHLCLLEARNQEFHLAVPEL
ncbi:hypothetical protein ACFQJ5_14260 [Halomicroarcula sp. GCM10025324]|uniref:DUF7527 domain-containing protein n=1 Tax=Haloarcula TaxID=2237 RepID=UPI0023E84D4E|nr:hypothetical protein [Halomicroarcula sp. ZS-22-S1]